MDYIEAIDEVGLKQGQYSIFLAGGITGCGDWQAEMVQYLSDLDVTLVNPRRKNFPIDDPRAAEEQIKWEFGYLQAVDAISFWFPKETLCPITLYELGSWMHSSKPLFIGVHPEYKRRHDVEIQTRLARKDQVIVYSIDELAGQIKRHDRHPKIWPF